MNFAIYAFLISCALVVTLDIPLVGYAVIIVGGTILGFVVNFVYWRLQPVSKKVVRLKTITYQPTNSSGVIVKGKLKLQVLHGWVIRRKPIQSIAQLFRDKNYEVRLVETRERVAIFILFKYWRMGFNELGHGKRVKRIVNSWKTIFPGLELESISSEDYSSWLVGN